MRGSILLIPLLSVAAGGVAAAMGATQYIVMFAFFVVGPVAAVTIIAIILKMRK